MLYIDFYFLSVSIMFCSIFDSIKTFVFWACITSFSVMYHLKAKINTVKVPLCKTCQQLI